MKVVAFSGLAAVAALAGVAIAAPAGAQPYPGYYYNGPNPCQEKQHNNGTAGALIGGAAGALLGNSLAHGGGRTGGTVIGGVAGAVIGNNVGRSAANGSDACEAQENGAYDNAPPPPAAYGAPPVAPAYDAPPPPPRYGYNGYDQAPPPPPSYYGNPHYPPPPPSDDDDDGY